MSKKLAHCRLTPDERPRLAAHGPVSAQETAQLAEQVRLAEARGVDFSPVSHGTLNHLRRIARGDELPEVAANFLFTGRRALAHRIGKLALPEQQRLVSGGKVALVVSEGRRRTSRMVDPLDLIGHQISQVFAADHVRTEDEQAAVIEGRANRGHRRR
jgi:hypothetical protein